MCKIISGSLVVKSLLEQFLDWFIKSFFEFYIYTVNYNKKNV